MDNSTRRPRAIIKINGEVVTGLIDLEVDQNSYYQADTFHLIFALQDKAAWWSEQSSVLVDVVAGFLNEKDELVDTKQLIYGKADDITINLVETTVEVSGRDLTSEFIDAKTSEKFQNLTSSQIVEVLAKRRGLTPVVVPTNTKAGTYYEIDHSRLASDKSEWDLLTWLAHEENYTVFVRGAQLFFQPKPEVTDSPYILQWVAPTNEVGHPVLNGKSISFSRNLTLAKDVIVTVRSWNSKQGKGFTKTVQATHNKNTVLSGAAQPTGEAQTYAYTIPGLTAEQTLQKAQTLLREITAHEVNLTCSMPADHNVDTTKVIKVIGTGTKFDQVYFPKSIISRMNMNEGYIMNITATNHSPESETIV